MRIAYDPIYNFHSGYHQEIIESTEGEIDWIKSSLVNFYEDCVWNSRNIDLRSSLFNHGYFVFDTSCDLILSPHMLLENKTPYVLELEKINWLFADDYNHASSTIDPWKIKLFEGLVLRDNLRSIIWYSNSARTNFINEFALKYSLSSTVVDKVVNISHTVYPSSVQVARTDDFINSKNNVFIIVANEKNWYRKGLDIIINIFIKLKEEGIANWNLKVVGGSFPKELEEVVVPIKDNLELVGLISKSQFLSLLPKSNCLLVPSRAETFGTVIVQAINSGCFVVASYGPNTFASREILEPWTNSSFVIDSISSNNEYDIPDEDKFYETIKNLIASPRVHPGERPTIYSREHLSQEFINIVRKIF